MLVNAHILGSTPEAVKKRRVRVARASSPAWTLSSDGKLPPLPENSFRRMFGPHGDANWLEPPNVKGRGRGRPRHTFLPLRAVQYPHAGST